MRKGLIASLAASFMLAAPAFAADLKIGLQEDPDVLDPAQSRTFVGRIVYTALCDKLVDITPDLKFVPQLATEWKWSDDGLQLTMKLRQGVKFHDGQPWNADAAIWNLDKLVKKDSPQYDPAQVAQVLLPDLRIRQARG